MEGWIWLLVKWMFALAFGIYSVFTMVVIKQVRVMNLAVEVEHGKVLEKLAWIYMLAALLLLLTVVVIL